MDGELKRYDKKGKLVKHGGTQMSQERAEQKAQLAAKVEANAIITGHTLQIMRIAEGADPDNLYGLKERLSRYVALCQQDGMLVSNIGAATAMGITARRLKKWENGTRADRKEFAQFVNAVCASEREAAMASGALNPVIGIFWQKNHDGFSDKPMEQQEEDEKVVRSARQIAEQYSLPDDEE